MANVVRNTLTDIGTLLPSSDIIANEKAISVAIGIPHPPAAPVPILSDKYIIAGTSIPSKAAPMGNIVLRRSDNSPPMNSRFSSSPTTKKNIDISPSFIQWCRL